MATKAEEQEKKDNEAAAKAQAKHEEQRAEEEAAAAAAAKQLEADHIAGLRSAEQQAVDRAEAEAEEKK